MHWVDLTANHLLTAESSNLLWIILWILIDNEFFHIFWFKSFSLDNIPYFNYRVYLLKTTNPPFNCLIRRNTWLLFFPSLLYSLIWKASSLNLCYLMGHNMKKENVGAQGIIWCPHQPEVWQVWQSYCNFSAERSSCCIVFPRGRLWFEWRSSNLQQRCRNSLKWNSSTIQPQRGWSLVKSTSEDSA